MEGQSFDFQSIDEYDPSLKGGYQVIFDQEIPYHLRYMDKDQTFIDMPDLEMIRTRVFALGRDNNLKQIKIELSNNKDLFFHYAAIINSGTFNLMQQDQGLAIRFQELSTLTIKFLNSCKNDTHAFSAIFQILEEGFAKMEMIESTEYKNVEIINFSFQSSPEDFIKNFITYRYQQEKNKLSLQEGRLSDVVEIIQLKNPSLFMQIHEQKPNSKRSIKVK